MTYYTRDGVPAFSGEEEEKRFLKWVKHIRDWQVVKVKESYRDKYGRIMYKVVEKVVGTGIAEPTAEELERAYKKPCRYRRAARASAT